MGSGPVPNFREAALQEAAVGVRGHELQRSLVRRLGVGFAAEAAQELGSGRVEVVVAVELEAVDEGERRLRVAGLGDRGGLIQLDDREPVRRASSP